MKAGCISVANHSLHCEAKAKSGDFGPQILYLKWEGRNYFHSAENEVEESKESKPQSLCML